METKEQLWIAEEKIIASEGPNLEGRMAKCTDCKNEVVSNRWLPFFHYRPEWKRDEYYCGCKGWE